MKFLVLLFSIILSSSAFAGSDIKWCSVKFNYDAYSFMHLLDLGKSSAAIITKDYKEVFVGTTSDAQTFIDNNSLEAFIIIFHLKSIRNPDLFEISIGQLTPKSKTSSKIKESDFVSSGSAQLPLSVGYKSNQDENINVLCKD